jgi:hypothetical protein
MTQTPSLANVISHLLFQIHNILYILQIPNIPYEL